MAGSRWRPDQRTSLTFRGATGPDVSIRISARICCSKVTSSNSEFRVAFGGLEWVGIQTAELQTPLIDAPLGARLPRKMQRLGSDLKEPPVRTLLACSFQLWFKRDRGTDHHHLWLCGAVGTRSGQCIASASPVLEAHP